MPPHTPAAITPNVDAETQLVEYFALLGTLLWDSRQRHSFATYAIGLMSQLERKSLEPIAASFTTDPSEAERLHDRLQNMVADAPWPDHEVRRLAANYALKAMLRRGPIETWICDDTSFLKSGNFSVGVQSQYCGCVGKVANCQVAPSLTVATKYTHLPIDMTLYLGKKWADKPQRRKKAKIPPEVFFQTKPELMLSLLQRARYEGIPPGIVLGDSAFGTSMEFRTGVRELQLHYALGVQLNIVVQVINRGVPSEPERIEQILKQLPAKAYRRYCWRTGSRGKLSARFAFRRVRVPNDPTGEVLWLILEWRDDDKEPCRAHLSSLPSSTSRPLLVYRLKERYRTEQMYREAKQEVGLDKYEGRGWPGFMHHVTVVLCCYAFLVAQREGAFPPCGPKGSRSPRAGSVQPPPPGPYAGATAAARPSLDCHHAAPDQMDCS